MKRQNGKTQGTAPRGAGWSDGPTFYVEGVNWRLHVRAETKGGWLWLKLRALGLARKANYPLGWSDAQVRFADTPSAEHLEYERPELFERVRQWLIDTRLGDAADLL